MRRERLLELVMGLVVVPSPTGDEGPLADYAATELAAAGLRAGRLPLDDRQASAWARLPGTGGGRDLMLYAPIDTLTIGRADADVPWIGPELRADMRPAPSVHGDYVVGLGAAIPRATSHV